MSKEIITNREHDCTKEKCNGKPVEKHEKQVDNMDCLLCSHCLEVLEYTIIKKQQHARKKKNPVRPQTDLFEN